MNRYLLLRDNKQSGPYTIDELVAKGIKAYDLVWQDGKSAAWRYPSEIEELKAYAPAVEEQPFDRFYKKPEAKPDHHRFEPKPQIETTNPSKTVATNKVYINFPNTARATTPVKVPAKQERLSVEPEPVQQIAEKIPAQHSTLHSTTDKIVSGRINKPYMTAAIITGFIALASISYLIISYNNQRRSINELNALVKQLAVKEHDKSMVQPAAAISEPNHELPPSATPDIKTPASVQVSETNNDVLFSENITTPKHAVPDTKAVTATVSKAQQPDGDVKITASSQPSTTGVANAPQLQKEEPVPTENLFKQVAVKANKYRTGVLGGVSNLQLELTNSSNRELHKVAVEIKYLGPEKRVVKRQTVYFENVAAGEKTTIDVPKSNRGVTIDIAITDIKS